VKHKPDLGTSPKNQEPMSAKPINMLQLKRIIQLASQGTSIRSVALQCQIARQTVRTYFEKIEGAGISYEELIELNEEQLAVLMFEPEQNKALQQERFIQLQKLLNEYSRDLKKTGVTKQLLWIEYRENYPDGYGYTQFCHYLFDYSKNKETVMHFTHIPGEKMMVDFAGKSFDWVTPDGEIKKHQVFVAILPYSGYSFVCAVESQKQQDFIRCLEEALIYFEGVPKIIVPDNLKSCVVKPDRYEPELTLLMQQFEAHYNVGIIPARVRKPRDKASVENMVNLAYQRVYAPLRNIQFTCLEEINMAFIEQLAIHHSKKFRCSDHSRNELFETEKKNLSPLPSTRFSMMKTTEIKVRSNYHIQLGEDNHYYSVPYKYTGEKVEVRYDDETLSVYHKHQCIAFHSRIRGRGSYTTNPLHMPTKDLTYKETKGYTASYFLSRAKRMAPEIFSVIEQVLKSKIIEQQTYNSCMGILNMVPKYPLSRLITTCQMALESRACNYAFVKNTLLNKADLAANQTQLDFTISPHENLRGKDAYQ
jgi:transposase